MSSECVGIFTAIASACGLAFRLLLDNRRLAINLVVESGLR